jgi:hypothetical protein
MSRSDHTKKPAPRMRRVTTSRRAARTALRKGQWEDMVTTMPTRATRVTSWDGE